jgi:hypothetical protein
MDRLIGVTSLVVFAAAAGTLTRHPAWLVFLGLCLAGFGIWRLTRCHHPRPLGLLPPTVDEHGERQPPQWFCAACGETWPAVFERANPPAPRFTGHDPSKALEAAKRAAALELRIRELAVKRAGMDKMDKPAAKPRRPEPVPIQSRRVAG